MLHADRSSASAFDAALLTTRNEVVVIREQLSDLLSGYGFDITNPFKLKLERPLEGDDRVRTAGLIAQNLELHGVKFEKRQLAEPFHPNTPVDYEVYVIAPIDPASGTAVSALNQFAFRASQISSKCEIFIDPTGDLNAYANASYGTSSVCAPLSAALEPHLCPHPLDPSLDHEILHIEIQSEFESGEPTFLITEMHHTDGIDLDGHQYLVTSEYACHLINFAHGLDRVIAPESVHRPLPELAMDVAAKAQEIWYFLKVSGVKVGIAETVAANVLYGEGPVYLEPKPKGEGCVLHLVDTKEKDGQLTDMFVSFRSHAEKFAEARISLQENLTAELMYSRHIRDTVTPIIKKLAEAGFMEFYGGDPVTEEQRGAVLACREIIAEYAATIHDLGGHGAEHHRYWASRECKETNGLAEKVQFEIYSPEGD